MQQIQRGTDQILLMKISSATAGATLSSIVAWFIHCNSTGQSISSFDADRHGWNLQVGSPTLVTIDGILYAQILFTCPSDATLGAWQSAGNSLTLSYTDETGSHTATVGAFAHDGTDSGFQVIEYVPPSSSPSSSPSSGPGSSGAPSSSAPPPSSTSLPNCQNDWVGTLTCLRATDNYRFQNGGYISWSLSGYCVVGSDSELDDFTLIVNWGDGQSETFDLGDFTQALHLYNAPGTYYVTGTFRDPRGLEKSYTCGYKVGPLSDASSATSSGQSGATSDPLPHSSQSSTGSGTSQGSSGTSLPSNPLSSSGGSATSSGVHSSAGGTSSAPSGTTATSVSSAVPTSPPSSATSDASSHEPTSSGQSGTTSNSLPLSSGLSTGSGTSQGSSGTSLPSNPLSSSGGSATSSGAHSSAGGTSAASSGTTATSVETAPPTSDLVCAITVEWLLPDEDSVLVNQPRLRFQVTDPNEPDLDPCLLPPDVLCQRFHPEYIEMKIGPYTLPLQVLDPNDPDDVLLPGKFPVRRIHKDDSPRNTTYEALIDTRDYANGRRSFTVKVKGVGCCHASAQRYFVVANTLQASIFYRDTRCKTQAGFVIPDAVVGFETRALEANKSRRYWVQHGARSGSELDGPYKHEDWPKHQPVVMTLGAQWNADGNRFERHNYSAHVSFRIPHKDEVNIREKWTPQYALHAFDLDAQTVAKIRPIEPGRHYVFTTSPARVWVYEDDQVSIYGDFSVAPTVDEDEIPSSASSGEYDYLDRAGDNIYAPTAYDVAVLATGGQTGDKIFVCVPPSVDAPFGELFAFDTGPDDVTLVYAIRRENRIPRFVETIGGKALALYIHDQGAALPPVSKRTRCYDLSFDAPRRVWELSDTATLAIVTGGKLFVACGHKLFVSTSGTSAPTLVREFGANVTAVGNGGTYVGLANGDVWKLTTLGWIKALTRHGAIGGVTAWAGGTDGEPNAEPDLGVVGGLGSWLSGERTDNTWLDERRLAVPVDLLPKKVDAVTALDHYSVSLTDGGGEASERDERLLAGTTEHGLFFVYQRSALSQKSGAIPVSHDSAQRVFPFRKPAPVAT